MLVRRYEITMDEDPTAAHFEARRGALIRQIERHEAAYYAFVYEDPTADMVLRLLSVFELDGGDPGPHAWIVSVAVGLGYETKIFADAGEAEIVP